jgi:ribosomal protein S18 acetylase RimI-like enzyme
MRDGTLVYRADTADEADILAHLSACDAAFSPPLSTRVELRAYAGKLAARAARFEAWSDGALVGLVAAYLNDMASGEGHVSNVSVAEGFTGGGVAAHLMASCIASAGSRGLRSLSLQVSAGSSGAIRLYRKLGFRVVGGDNEPLLMTLAVSGAPHDE